MYLLILILVSCKAINSSMYLKEELREVKLNDKISNIVRKFRKENITNNNDLVFLSFENKLGSLNNTFYVHRVGALSVIYKYHISFFAMVDDIPVLISSREDGFIDVDNYDEKLISILTKYLEDDMLMRSIIKIDDYFMIEPVSDSATIDHRKPWKITNQKIIKGWKKHPIEEGVMFINKEYSGQDYYRVIEGGQDDREKGETTN